MIKKVTIDEPNATHMVKLSHYLKKLKNKRIWVYMKVKINHLLPLISLNVI